MIYAVVGILIILVILAVSFRVIRKIERLLDLAEARVLREVAIIQRDVVRMQRDIDRLASQRQGDNEVVQLEKEKLKSEVAQAEAITNLLAYNPFSKGGDS